MKLQFPSGNQLLNMALAIVIVNFAARMLPENLKALFRV